MDKKIILKTLLLVVTIPFIMGIILFKTKDNDKTIYRSVPPPKQVKIYNDDRLIKNLDIDNVDADMLMKIAVAETNGKDVKCMALVMLTVLNRVWSPDFPDSIEEVIYQQINGEYIFPAVKTGLYQKVHPTDNSIKALDLVLDGWNESENALYFDVSNRDSWLDENAEFLYRCNNLKFFK